MWPRLACVHLLKGALAWVIGLVCAELAHIMWPYLAQCCDVLFVQHEVVQQFQGNPMPFQQLGGYGATDRRRCSQLGCSRTHSVQNALQHVKNQAMQLCMVCLRKASVL